MVVGGDVLLPSYPILSSCIGMSMSVLLEAGVSKGAAKDDREHVDLWMGSMRLKTSWLTNNS